MSRVHEVWSALDQAVASGADGALVTVAHTEGSAYQREGAKLLFRDGAEAIGTISGGCLEADVFEHCRQAIARGEPTVVRYETGSLADTVFGGGTGCQGTIELLIEPLAAWRDPDGRALLSAVNEALRLDRRVVIATVIRSGESVPAKLPRLLVDGEGRTVGELADFALRTELLAEARAALADDSRRPSRKVERLVEGVRREALIDVIVPPTRLVVFGAGEDAAPLVRIAAAAGMHVTVADWRSELLAVGRLAEAGARVRLRGEEFPGPISLSGNPAVLLMTHNYLADRSALERIAARPERLSYLGVLGPRSRTARLVSELGSEVARLEVHTPAGLDLGAETPEEIALSIVAEILAVRRNRSGRPLRELNEPVGEPVLRRR